MRRKDLLWLPKLLFPCCDRVVRSWCGGDSVDEDGLGPERKFGQAGVSQSRPDFELWLLPRKHGWRHAELGPFGERPAANELEVRPDPTDHDCGGLGECGDTIGPTRPTGGLKAHGSLPSCGEQAPILRRLYVMQRLSGVSFAR